MNRRRRLERGFRAPGENEGFMDYMLRRATQGAYDKRDEQSYDSDEDEENSSDELPSDETRSNNSSKTKKSKSKKKSSESSASKISSDTVAGNDNFSVISDFFFFCNF